MMKKLRSRRGETLVETLVSLLIVVLCLSFLATAIVTAARINAGARDTDVSVRYGSGTSAPQTVAVTPRGIYAGDAGFTETVTLHTTDNGYRYYTTD